MAACFHFVIPAMKCQHTAYIKQLQIPKSIERIIGAHKDERGRNDITLRTWTIAENQSQQRIFKNNWIRSAGYSVRIEIIIIKRSGI
jgi:hypothetical protein